MKKVFYKCGHCGNMVGLIHNGGGTLTCCGDPMTRLEANSTDAAQEKHVPAVSLSGKTLSVQVGETLHPMTAEHFIQWIMVTQNGKTQRVELAPGNEPKAAFTLDSAADGYTVFAYCNLHGLWMKDS
jgi:superoxide reductase